MSEYTAMVDRIFKRLPMFSEEKPNKVEEWLSKVAICERLVPREVSEEVKIANLIL